MKTILVVDDEPEVRKLVAAMLVNNGYHVLIAGTAQQAVQLFKGNPETDLLLTDVGDSATAMSGPITADQIAVMKPDIKVLFMSGYDGTQAIQRYVAEKGYAQLVKPFTMEQLAGKIRTMLVSDDKSIGTTGETR